MSEAIEKMRRIIMLFETARNEIHPDDIPGALRRLRCALIAVLEGADIDTVRAVNSIVSGEEYEPVDAVCARIASRGAGEE